MGKKHKKSRKRKQTQQTEPEFFGSFTMDEGMPAELAEMLSSNGIDPAKFLDDMVQRHLPKLEAMRECPDPFDDLDDEPDFYDHVVGLLGQEVSKAKNPRGQSKALKDFFEECDPDYISESVVDVAINVCREHATDPKAFLETILTHARGYMKRPQFQLDNWTRGEFHPTADILSELVMYSHMTQDHRRRDKYLDELQKLDPDFRGHPPHALISIKVDQGDYRTALSLLIDYWAAWFTDDPFAHYNKVMLAYLLEGPSKDAEAYLKSAFEFFPDIAIMLVQNVDPHEIPEGGDVSKEQSLAKAYLSQHLPLWRAKPGVLAWVRETLGVNPQGEADDRRRQEHKQRLCKQRLRLAEDWSQRADAEIIIDSIKDPDGNWVVFGTVNGAEGDSDAPRHVERYDHMPKPAEMLGELMEMMSRWMDEEGYPGMRPGRVVVRLKSLVTSWKKRLGKLEIDCVVADESQQETFSGVQKLLGNAADHERIDIKTVSFDDLRSMELDPEASWEIFARKMPTWTTNKGKHCRLWAGVVVELGSELLLGSHVSPGEMSAEDQARFLVASILKPIVSVPPVIPGKIRVCDQELYEIIDGPFSEMGANVELVDSLEMASEILDDMAEGIAKENDPGPMLVNIPGVTQRHFDDFYEAADLYYRLKPWRYLDDTQPIEIAYQKESGKEEEKHYAMVMGNGGLTFGLAFYFTWESLVQLMEGPQPAKPGESMSIIYGEQFEIPVPEFDMIDERKYPVENSEAYPLFLRIRPGRTIQVPLLHELEKITACLNGVAKLVERQIKPTTVAVNLASGKHHLSLSVKPMR